VQVDSHGGQASAFALLRELFRDIGALTVRVICLPVFALLVMCEPVVRVTMTTLALLGVFSSIVLELSGAAPHFPFWSALAFFTGCGAVPWLYRAGMRLFAP